MNTNFTMNAIACKQAKDIFDHMLMTDMPGQNWDCVLIDDMGNGRNLHRVTPGVETSCVCFKKAGEKNLIMRTSKDNPLKFGMLIYIGKQEKFYLLKDHPTPQIDCIAVVPTLCTHMIKFYVKLPDKVDENGMLVEEGVCADVTGNIPSVVTRKTASYVSGTNTPGILRDEELEVAVQFNETMEIRKDDLFDLDGKQYKVYDFHTDGTIEDGGILYLTCRRRQLMNLRAVWNRLYRPFSSSL